MKNRRLCGAALLAVLCTVMTGCEPLSLAALGVGGTAAVNHKVGGSPTRTFTASLSKVRVASMGALKRMGIRAHKVLPTENGELITARAGQREIEIALESVTPGTTRMQVVAHDGGFFYDASTASEIIAQTGKALGI